MRTIGTDWVDRLGFTGEQVGLAAAAAEVLFFAGAGEAGFGHPGVAAEAVKCGRRGPYPGEVVFACVVKGQTGNDPRCVAGHRLADGVDEHHLPSPATDAGL